MTLIEAAVAYYGLLAALSARSRRRAKRLWAKLDQSALASSWDREVRDALLAEVATAQQMAAIGAQRYVSASVAAQGATSIGEALISSTLAGIASDGRDLDSLLFQPLLETLGDIAAGVPVTEAMRRGESALDTIVGTQVSDAGRAASQVELAIEPSVTGYVRMLTPPSCGRCAVLAGRVYRWSTGFDRHPQDDCIMVPAVEDQADDIRTDPDAYFNSLDSAEQDRQFTKAGAEAIRRGADISQVVNSRRGALGLSQPGRLTDAEQAVLKGGRRRGRIERADVYGRQVYVTTEGTTTRGVAGKRLIDSGGATTLRTADERRADRARGDTGRQPRRAKTPRLMPEAILELADGDRDTAERLLRRFGYIP